MHLTMDIAHPEVELKAICCAIYNHATVEDVLSRKSKSSSLKLKTGTARKKKTKLKSVKIITSRKSRVTRENWRKSVPLFRMWVPLTWERCEEKHDVVEDDDVVEQQEDGDLFSFQQGKWLTQYSLHSYLSFLVNMIVSSQYEVHLNKKSF